MLLVGVNRHDNGCNNIGQNPGACTDKKSPEQADDGGVYVEIFTKAAAYAAEHFVTAGTV